MQMQMQMQLQVQSSKNHGPVVHYELLTDAEDLSAAISSAGCLISMQRGQRALNSNHDAVQLDQATDIADGCNALSRGQHVAHRELLAHAEGLGVGALIASVSHLIAVQQ